MVRVLLLLALACPVCACAAASGPFSTRQRSSPAPDLATGHAPAGLPDPRLREPASRPADNIVIVSVQPAKLQPGVKQTVTVRVRYSLVTAPRGVINVGFNTGSAASFRLLKERWIDAGTAEIDVAVDVVPAQWPDRPFKAFVNLTTEGNPRRRSSLAADVLPLKLN